MSFIIMSHNNGEGARALAERLGCRLASHSSDKAFPNSIRTVINFGCSPDHPVVVRSQLSTKVTRRLNAPTDVQVASSKLASFQRFNTYKAGICIRFATYQWELLTPAD